MKVTFDIDPDLYRSIKVEAARTDRSIRDVVAEALAGWLELREDDEDRASSADALAEYERDGGVDGRRLLRAPGGRGTRRVRVPRLRSGEPYRVELAPAAARQLRRLPPGDAARLRGPILALGIEPRPPSAPLLTGTTWWRLRVGDLRLVYAIQDEARLVVVLRVARRDEATYRRLWP